MKADVNALDRLQIVRDRNSSYFGSKYRSCTAREVFRSFQFAFDERLIDHDLGCDIGEFAFLPKLDLLAHGIEIALPAHVTFCIHTVNTPETMFSKFESVRSNFPECDLAGTNQPTGT